MPAVKITQKPIGIPGDDTHFLVTQPELPESYTPTGQETEEQLDALKVESVREIQMDDMVALFQEKFSFDATPTAGSANPVTSGGIKAALDVIDGDLSAVTEDVDKMKTATFFDVNKALSPKTVVDGKVTEWQFKTIDDSGYNKNNYNTLDNKPQINGVTLVENKSLSDIGAASASDVEDLQTGKQDVLTFDQTPTAGSDNPVTSSGVKSALDAKSPAILNTVSGSVASFANGADDLPLKSCVVKLDPIQEGEGDPSPENVRPISGRTGLTVVRSGKNLVDDSIKRINAANTAIAIGGGTAEYYLFLYPGVYTLSCKFADGVHYGALYKETNSSQVTIWTTSGTDTKASFIISKAGLYRLWFYRSSGDGGVSVDNVSDVLLELGSEATDYEPYKGSTYTVNWETEAGTVYGGSLDGVSGKLTVDKKGVSLNDPSKWSQGSAGVFTYALGASDRAIYSDSYYGLICSHYTAKYTLPQYCRWSAATSGNFRINDSNATLEGLQALSQSGDLKIVYVLAEPIEYQLSANEIRTLLGENNIWSDGGDISVEYPADTKTYIDAFSIKTVEVSGQTPTITAEENTRYICGEVTSLDFTPCASGICDIRFTAASISTVLTLPQTLKLPDWFDPTALEANVTYEINIVDGVYGAVMSWA